MNDLVIQKVKRIKTQEEFRQNIVDISSDLTLIISENDLKENYRQFREKAREFGLESLAVMTAREIFKQNEDIELFERISEVEITSDNILTTEAFEPIYSMSDMIEVQHYLSKLRGKAKTFKIPLREFDGLAKAYTKEAEKRLRRCTITEQCSNIDDFPYIYASENQNTGEIKYRVSCPKLAEHIRKNSYYMFVRNEATNNTRRYWYIDGVYKLITDDELKGLIKQYITDFSLSILKMSDVKEVFNDLITDRKFISECELNTDENIVNFQNGLLYLDTMELKPHTPEIKSTIQIPCNWNTNSCECPVFDSFIDTLTGGKADKKKFLLQYMGTCLSNIKGYRMKKALFMVGAGDTGKSRLKELTEMLLGEENSSAGDLKDLEKRFGAYKLYGKRLSGASDMGYVTVSELRLFKQITGGDLIDVEGKGKDSFSYKYNGLLWFCTNELPKFGGDRGEWVYNRIIPFECNNVVPVEKRDKDIVGKMFREREAIVFRAISAVKEVISNGYEFDIPEECIVKREEYKKANSPVMQFYDECCMERPDGTVKDNCTASIVHEALKLWCKENTSGYVPKIPDFKKEIAQHINIDEKSLIKKIHGIRYYIFTLTPETKEMYRFYDTAS